VHETLSQIDQSVVGEQIAGAICEFVPGMARSDDPEVRTTMVGTATANVARAVDGLLAGAAPQDVEMPSANHLWVEDLVHRGLDVSTVPWSCNYGQSGLADALREVVRDADIPGVDKLTVADDLSKYAAGYVSSVCAQMVEHYETEHQLWAGGATAVRREVVNALLEGRLTDAQTAGETLGYSLAGHHVGVIVWAHTRGDSQRPGQRELEASARTLLRTLGAVDAFTVSAGATACWAWGSGADVRDAVGENAQIDVGMYAAVGGVGEGLDGFVRSHHDATQARRMAGLLSRRPGSVINYRAVALTSLIARDPRQAARFVDDELGPLAGDTDSMRRLRATLTVFFEESMRITRTARRLGVHQNTVLYRVEQVETLLGRPLGERRLELETALRLADARDALAGVSV
jgi:hypothetical protein